MLCFLSTTSDFLVFFFSLYSPSPFIPPSLLFSLITNPTFLSSHSSFDTMQLLVFSYLPSLCLYIKQKLLEFPPLLLPSVSLLTRQSCLNFPLFLFPMTLLLDFLHSATWPLCPNTCSASCISSLRSLMRLNFLHVLPSFLPP